MTTVAGVQAQVAPVGPMALFGDLEGKIWGFLAGATTPSLAVAECNGEQPLASPVQLDLGDSSVWTVTGPGCSLRIEAAEAGSTTAEAGSTTTQAGVIQPCLVTGSLTVHGTTRELVAPGVRSQRLGSPEHGRLRLFASWFPAGPEIALLSLRPDGSASHDRDRITMVARGEERPLVVDPRLSTTYDRDGNPLRVGIEFWLGEAGEEEDGLLPRRVAGHATGAVASAATLRAHAFSCVSRGEPGTGVYLLGGHRAG